jgi:hypothetical protein
MPEDIVIAATVNVRKIDMPVMPCQLNGKPGFKWGKSGKCYTYSSEQGKKTARDKAAKQGRAVEANRSK